MTVVQTQSALTCGWPGVLLKPAASNSSPATAACTHCFLNHQRQSATRPVLCCRAHRSWSWKLPGSCCCHCSWCCAILLLRSAASSLQREHLVKLGLLWPAVAVLATTNIQASIRPYSAVSSSLFTNMCKWDAVMLLTSDW